MLLVCEIFAIVICYLIGGTVTLILVKNTYFKSLKMIYTLDIALTFWLWPAILFSSLLSSLLFYLFFKLPEKIFKLL